MVIKLFMLLTYRINYGCKGFYDTGPKVWKFTAVIISNNGKLGCLSLSITPILV